MRKPLRESGPAMLEQERLNRARWRVIGMALQFGSTVIGALLIGLVGGGWLDRRLGTSPLFLLVGLLFAFLGIGYSLYELAIAGRSATPKRDRAAGQDGAADGTRRT